MSDGDRDHGRPGASAIARVSFERRRMLQWLLLPATQLAIPSLAWATAARVAAARIWPAREYTRLVLEAPVTLEHQLFVLRDPHRIVLDIAAAELTPELQQLAARLQPDDPYIASIRFGRQPPDILRLVIDLRAEVVPQLFELAPVAGFGYRLVLDLYPATPIDPLMALLENRRSDDAPAASEPAPGRRSERDRGDARTRARSAHRAAAPDHHRARPGARRRGPRRDRTAGERARRTSCWRSPGS